MLFTDATPENIPITENIFSGETVFLHFDSNILESRQHEIRKQLRFQGAIISHFFNKKVSLVLSNKSAAGKTTKNEGQSFWQTDLSRGATMVRQALERKKGENAKERCNFIQRAKMDGIRVVYIEDIKLGVRPLHAPFIKVEDHSRQYRPLVLEMNKWPSLDEVFHEDSDISFNEQPKKETNKYCGLCEQYFTNSSYIHVKSSIHTKNAEDDTRWSNVDKLISRQQTPAELEESLIRKRRETQGAEKRD